jgi:hypothetical protein
MPTISRNGHRLAYAMATVAADLWRVRLSGPELTNAARPEKWITSTHMQIDPQYSPDGSRIAFVSDRSGKFEIWVTDERIENSVQITQLDQDPGSPAWSPDGSEIAFDSLGTDIGVVRADGGPPRRVTSHAINFTPSWSRDGQWIYFASDRSGDFQIWKAPKTGESAGSPAIQITSGGGFRGFESFDAAYLYYSKGRGKSGLWRRALHGQPAAEEPVVPQLQNWGWWALAQNGIYFIEEQGSSTFLKRLVPPSKAAQMLSQLPAPAAVTTSVLGARFDGRDLVYVKMDSSGSDIMLIENFR